MTTPKPKQRLGDAPLRRVLDGYLLQFDKETHLQQDPLALVRPYKDSPADAELVGLIASALAFGRVTSIRDKIRDVLARLGDKPAEAIHRLQYKGLQQQLQGFQHRWTLGDDLAALLAGADVVIQREGSLGLALARFYKQENNLRGALVHWTNSIRAAAPPTTRKREFSHLLPDVLGGSACKRLLLYLRWMVRCDDGVDLGLWEIPPAALSMPVDTHIARIAHYMGLCAKEEASWKTSEEITEVFRRLDPTDPIKYDFALCHLGVSGSCPRQQHPVHCQQCPIREGCRL